jgi:hypothetical protein
MPTGMMGTGGMIGGLGIIVRPGSGRRAGGDIPRVFMTTGGLSSGIGRTGTTSVVTPGTISIMAAMGVGSRALMSMRKIP